MTIQVSTKVCSFGKQVVEKVETEYARYQDGKYIYKLDRSPIWVGFPRTGIYPDICHFFENFGGLLWPYLIS